MNFLQASDDVVDAFISLSEDRAITDEVILVIAKFVCAVYIQSKGDPHHQHPRSEMALVLPAYG